MLLHRRKITVIVEQDVLMPDAERADDSVGRFANRNASASQSAIVAGSAGSEVRTQELHKIIAAGQAGP
jgi:hypothetical protein